MCFVRLACVRHAASVHPEPGSNSPFERGPVLRAPDQTDSVPVWKCCLSIRTAASEMRRIKINVKDRNDGSLSFRLPCVHPNNSLAYHNLPFVHFVWTVSGSQGPRGPAGPPPRLFGIRSLPCGASEYTTLTPGGCQQVISDFFEIARGGPLPGGRGAARD